MFICICIIYTKQNQKKFQCPTDNNNESAIKICTSSEFVKILLIKHKQNYWTNNLDVLK